MLNGFTAMFMTIGEEVSDGLKIEYPYFEREQPMTWEEDTSYIQDPDAPKITATRSRQWNHSWGEIISALIRTGLVEWPNS